MPSNGKRRLRSQLWFDNPDNPGMTALYLERYLNYAVAHDSGILINPMIVTGRPRAASPMASAMRCSSS